MDRRGKGERRYIALYPDRMPALKAGNVMAFPQERMNGRGACLSTKVVPQGDFHALSFEQEDRAVFMESVQSSKFKVLSLNAPPEVIP